MRNYEDALRLHECTAWTELNEAEGRKEEEEEGGRRRRRRKEEEADVTCMFCNSLSLSPSVWLQSL